MLGGSPPGRGGFGRGGSGLQFTLQFTLQFSLQFTLQIVYYVFYPIKLGKLKSLQIHFTIHFTNHFIIHFTNLYIMFLIQLNYLGKHKSLQQCLMTREDKPHVVKNSSVWLPFI